MLIFISLLPGQLCVLQAAVLMVLPVHGTPPFVAFRSTLRTPCLVPPPQVFVHSVHVCQFPQRQSTYNEKRNLCINVKKNEYFEIYDQSNTKLIQKQNFYLDKHALHKHVSRLTRLHILLHHFGLVVQYLLAGSGILHHKIWYNHSNFRRVPICNQF